MGQQVSAAGDERRTKLRYRKAVTWDLKVVLVDRKETMCANCANAELQHQRL